MHDFLNLIIVIGIGYVIGSQIFSWLFIFISMFSLNVFDELKNDMCHCNDYTRWKFFAAMVIPGGYVFVHWRIIRHVFGNFKSIMTGK